MIRFSTVFKEILLQKSKNKKLPDILLNRSLIHHQQIMWRSRSSPGSQAPWSRSRRCLHHPGLACTRTLPEPRLPHRRLHTIISCEGPTKFRHIFLATEENQYTDCCLIPLYHHFSIFSLPYIMIILFRFNFSSDLPSLVCCVLHTLTSSTATCISAPLWQLCYALLTPPPS